MRMLRHQLPVRSPLDAPALLGAGGRARAAGASSRAALEGLLARTYRADEVVLCGSGTHALQLAIEAAADRAGRGALVALPAFTCYSVATAAVGAGVPITLYDVDPATLAPDLGSLRRALEDGARTVVVSHLHGHAVPWDAITTLTAGFGAIPIEDAAQGHGATWRGRPLGALGPASVLSFGRGKGWTGGGGGALLLRGPLAGTAAQLRARLARPRRTGPVAISAGAQWAFGRPSIYGLLMAVPWLALGETVYHDPTPPAALPAYAAGLLLRTRDAALYEAALRRATGQAFARVLARAGTAGMIRPVPGTDPGYLRFPIRLPGGLSGLEAGARRGGADAASLRRLGIFASYPQTLAELPAVARRYRGRARAWPGAAELARTLVTLPTHSLLSATERRAILQCVVARAGAPPLEEMLR